MLIFSGILDAADILVDELSKKPDLANVSMPTIDNDSILMGLCMRVRRIHQARKTCCPGIRL